MSSVLRSLLIKVGVDLTDAQKGFKQAAREFKAQGKELTSIGKTLTTGITLPVLGAAAASIKYASDMEESMNKVNVAFRDSADDVKSWSDTALKSFGIAKGTALDMAATFGDMGTAMGLVPNQAANMSTSLAGLAGDLASFKNIDIGQASDALRGVFTGEGEALKTLGIIMQENTLQAYALANGYKTAYKDMSQTEKVTLRYKYVMEATKNAQGDFARTSGGVANQMRIAQEQLKQTAATLGSNLLPQVAKGLQSLNSMVESFANLSDETKQNIIVAAGFAAAIGPVIMAIGKMNLGISGLLTGLSAATKAIKGGAGLVGAFGAMIGPAGVVTLAVIAIGALAAGLAIAYNKAHATEKRIAALNKTFEESAQTFEKSNQELAANTSLANKLATELYQLNDKEKKTNIEKARMVALVNQLNKLMPELNLSIDEQTGMLNKNWVATKNLINEKKRQMQVSLTEERLLEIYRENAVLTDEMADAQKRLKQAYEDLAEAQEIGTQEAFIKVDIAMQDAQTSVTALSEALVNNELRAAELERAHDKMVMGIVEGEQQISEATSSSTELTEEELKARDKLLEEYYEKFRDKTQEHINQMGSIEDEGIEKSKITADEVKENLEQQIKDFKDWHNNIVLLSGRVPETVLSDLRGLGPQYAPLIAELKDMTNEELDEFVAVWQQKTEAAKLAAEVELGEIPFKAASAAEQAAIDFGATFDEHLDEIKLKTKTVGNYAVDGLVDGLEEHKSMLKKKIKELTDLVPNDMMGHLGIQSPSKVTVKIGAFTGQGFVKGIASQFKAVKGVAAGLSDALVNNLDPSMAFPSMAQPGGLDLQSTAGQSAGGTSMHPDQFKSMVAVMQAAMEGMGLYYDEREVAKMMRKAQLA